MCKLKKREFRIGDKVRWNGCKEERDNIMFHLDDECFLKTKEVHIIRNIGEDNNCKLLGDGRWYSLQWFEHDGEPQFEFEAGEDVEVSNDDGIWKRRVYIGTIDGSVYPYFCAPLQYKEDVKQGKKVIPTSWLNIRPAEIQHVPYRKPKFEWVDKNKIVKYKGIQYTICSITKLFNGIYNIGIKSDRRDMSLSLKEAFEKLIWLDGKPFGKEIKQ